MSSARVLKALRRRETDSGVSRRRLGRAVRSIQPSTEVPLENLCDDGPGLGILGTVVLGFAAGVAEMLVSFAQRQVEHGETILDEDSPGEIFLQFWRIQRAGGAPCKLLRELRLFPLPRLNLDEIGLLSGGGWIAPPLLRYREYPVLGVALVTCHPREVGPQNEAAFEVCFALVTVPGNRLWQNSCEVLVSAAVPWERGTTIPEISLVYSQTSVNYRIIAQNESSICVFDIIQPRKSHKSATRNEEPHWYQITPLQTASAWDFQLRTNSNKLSLLVSASQFDVEAFIQYIPKRIMAVYLAHNYDFEIVEIHNNVVFILFWVALRSRGGVAITYAQTFNLGVVDLVSGKIRLLQDTESCREFLLLERPMPPSSVYRVRQELALNARRRLCRLTVPSCNLQSKTLVNSKQKSISRLQSGPLRICLNKPG